LIVTLHSYSMAVRIGISEYCSTNLKRAQKYRQKLTIDQLYSVDLLDLVFMRDCIAIDRTQ